MFGKYPLTAFLTALSMLCFAGMGTAAAHGSGDHPSMTKQAGDYTITLKLLPAESFVEKSNAKESTNAGEMVNGGGAEPVHKKSSQNPNHHLVTFIKKNGKPVEHADVEISYKKESGSNSEMKKAPVTRMWVAGKGQKTTHYGNNVRLEPGKYQVHVAVNGEADATFHLTVQ